jgi:hypothetical protein
MISKMVDIPEPSVSSIIVVIMLSSSISTVDKLPEVEKLDDDEPSGVDEVADVDRSREFVVCLVCSLKPEPSISSGGRTSIAVTSG